jgi:hypothetical protein
VIAIGTMTILAIGLFVSVLCVAYVGIHFAGQAFRAPPANKELRRDEVIPLPVEQEKIVGE